MTVCTSPRDTGSQLQATVNVAEIVHVEAVGNVSSAGTGTWQYAIAIQAPASCCYTSIIKIS